MSSALAGLLTTAQVVERTGKHRRTIERWIASGRLIAAERLPGPTGDRLFRVEDVDRAAAGDVEEAS